MASETECAFDDTSIIVREETADRIAGGIIGGVSIIAFVWYCFVLVNIVRLTKKIPTFVVFFSQGIGDIGFLLNSLWLAVDIIVGPTILLQDTKIYSIALNAFARPVLFHFLLIAIIRFISAWFPKAFKTFSNCKTIIILICICFLVWIAVWIEIGVFHFIWPSDAFVNHNISLYGFYSQDICYYLNSNYVIYHNGVNVGIGVLTLLLYIGCLIACCLRRNSAGAIHKTREGKLLAYCLIDFLVVFILYALKAVLYSQIRSSRRPILLLVQIVYTCTFLVNAILLPVFSADLWRSMFPRKHQPLSNATLPHTALASKPTVTGTGAVPPDRFGSGGISVEGL